MSAVVLRVVVADPHEGMRRALLAVLSRDPRFSVAAVVTDLRAAGSEARRRGADVLVVDAGLLSGHRSDLGPLPASTRVVALGMDAHPAAAERARRDGASSYLPKDQAGLLLGEALRPAPR
jgi:DNA-binding NarL/FixJ family response regulator